MFRIFGAALIAALLLGGCATVAESTTMLSDEKILSQTAGALGYPATDLTITSRRTEGTNTYVDLRAKDRKEFTCIINGGKALTMRLPLVGLELDTALRTDRKKSCTQAQGKAEKSRGRLTAGERLKIPAMTEIDGDAVGLSGEMMCGAPSEKSSTSCGTENAKNGKPLARQGSVGEVNVSFSTQTKTSVTHVNPGSDIQPAAVTPITPPAAAGGKNPEKPEIRFRDIVADESDGAIRYLDSEKSMGIYKSWVFAKLDEQVLRDAVRQVISDISRQPTPDSIDTALRLMHAPKRDTTKGRLAL